MATHKSAEKRIRQSERRRIRNKNARSRMRTVVKRFRAAVESGDVEDATTRFRLAEREVRKAATRGIIPRTRAGRTVSRLAKQLGTLKTS